MPSSGPVGPEELSWAVKTPSLPTLMMSSGSSGTSGFLPFSMSPRFTLIRWELPLFDLRRIWTFPLAPNLVSPPAMETAFSTVNPLAMG